MSAADFSQPPVVYRGQVGYAPLGNRDEPMSRPPDLVQGTLDLLILKILALETASWQRLSDAISLVVALRET